MKRRGHPQTPETRAKISAASKGRKGKIGWVCPPEVKEKIRMARRSKDWTGRKTTPNGYVLIYCPHHPVALNGGYVYEHRLVMEKKLGRYLTSGEAVHHRNGVKDDNRPENLELVARNGAHYGGVICPFCEKHFLIQ